MKTTPNGEPPFDNELFGMLLRRARQKAGYATGEDFCKDLSIWGGVDISKDKLYRIEAGKQAIAIDVLLAAAVVLKRGQGCAKPSEALAAMDIDRCSCSYYGELLGMNGEHPIEDLHGFDGEPYTSERKRFKAPF